MCPSLQQPSEGPWLCTGKNPRTGHSIGQAGLFRVGHIPQAECGPCEKALIQRVVSLVLFLYNFTYVFVAVLSLHHCTGFLQLHQVGDTL